jgi:tagaturonate reductase
MNLSKQTLKNLSNTSADVPGQKCFALPEKVLQFGTGVLLRGLPDYFIDKANKQGIFNGRVVVVKSTGNGDADAFATQDGLYTLSVSGIEDGRKVEEKIVNASISRVLNAKTEWEKVLECAANADMQVIISNTTEVGITLVESDDIKAAPPESFPGKLLAFLYARYKAFNGDVNKGMVIVPTELIPDNGSKLEGIVEELAHLNKLEFEFIDWLENANYFCNSLVDRIVPGKLPLAKQHEVEHELGYKDELMIMSEVYRLWAIQSSDKKVVDALSFAKADEGVVIAANIDRFRELKLRLLNGSHTFSCGLAHLAGFHTVKDAMDDENFASYITNLMLNEIVPSIVNDEITKEEANDFTYKVLDRYRNPHIDHQWLSITMQYSSKMAMRNIPTIINHYTKVGNVPEAMALGFAAHLLFMRSEKDALGKFWGENNGRKYLITDDNAAYYHNKWKKLSVQELVQSVLADEERWDIDLTTLPGFEKAVYEKLQALINDGATAALEKAKALVAA